MRIREDRTKTVTYRFEGLRCDVCKVEERETENLYYPAGIGWSWLDENASQVVCPVCLRAALLVLRGVK